MIDLRQVVCLICSNFLLLCVCMPLLRPSPSLNEHERNSLNELLGRMGCDSRLCFTLSVQWLVQKDGRTFVHIVHISVRFYPFMSYPYVIHILSVRESISDQTTSTRTNDKLRSRVRSRRHELFPRMTEVEQISGTTSSSCWKGIEGRETDEGDGWDRSALQNS